MAARKTERLLNLVICLLATRQYLSVERIRRAVPQYAESGQDEVAFRRMFERDKEELRELGIPLETGSSTAWEDEVGYRIPRGRYELPPIRLEPDEAAALGLAARLWHSEELAGAVTGALRKLAAAGVEVDAPLPPGLSPRVDATDAAFRPMWDAVRAGQGVRFGYRGLGAAQPGVRHLEPWGVCSWRGRWYVVGHDRDRDATRVFRLSRVTGPVRTDGPAGTVTVPPGTDVRGLVRAVAARGGTQLARLRVRPGAGYELRRGAERDVPGDDGWDVVELRFSDAERLAERVVGFGSAVVVLAPPELRAGVVRRLQALTGTTP